MGPTMSVCTKSRGAVDFRDSSLAFGRGFRHDMTIWHILRFVILFFCIRDMFIPFVIGIVLEIFKYSHDLVVCDIYSALM